MVPQKIPEPVLPLSTVDLNGTNITNAQQIETQKAKQEKINANNHKSDELPNEPKKTHMENIHKLEPNKSK